MLMTKSDANWPIKRANEKRQHYVTLRGAIPAILERISDSDPSAPSTVYAKYLEEIPCHVCGGTKLRKEVLEYKIGGLNYADIESMELTALLSWIQQFSDKRIFSVQKRSLLSNL